jgi:hypothetical protein
MSGKDARFHRKAFDSLKPARVHFIFGELTMQGKLFEGTIDFWTDRGNAAGFGFILFSAGGRQLDRIFYAHDDIVPDSIGRRQHGRILGNLVRFKLGKHLHRGQPTAKALDVESVFPVDIANAEAHREVSTVDHILKGTREPIAAVFLKRNCGDKLYLSCDGVVPEFRDRWKTLRVGSRVYHGVAAPTERQKTWQAVAAEIFAPGE